MNNNLSIFGKTYTGVTAITLTDTNNQQQKFINTSDTTATAEDVISSKYFYTSAGVKTSGTLQNAVGVNF